MKKIRVHYIFEPEGWAAESPDRPRWSAWGDSLEEVRQLASEGLPKVFGEPIALVEIFPATNGILIAPKLSFHGVSASGPAQPAAVEPALTFK